MILRENPTKGTFFPKLKARKRGFTLIETLVAVTIISVLLAVSVPAVLSLQQHLEMQELDDVARQIFLAAQNELTAMKSDGSLDEFRKELEKNYPNQNLGNMGEKPADYGAEDSNWKLLYYINSDDDILKYVLGDNPVLRSYIGNGSFVLEINPQSGDIYGAFYTKWTPLSYQKDILTLLARSQKWREEQRIGYYGGQSGSSAGVILPKQLEPKIEVKNGEDLYLEITCSDLPSVIAKTQKKLSLTLTATDESYQENGTDHIWKETITGGSLKMTVSATGEAVCYVLLDSLRPDQSFAKLTEGKLTPGDDLNLTAVMTYQNRDIIITGSATGSTNSLFADKKKENDGLHVQVAHLRHLNNLRSSIYQCTETTPVFVEQIRNIDFDASHWQNQELMPGRKKENPLKAFEAITNETLFTRSKGGAVSFHGGGSQLRNFLFDSKSSKQVGLFAQTKDCKLEEVRLIDCAMKGDYSNAGMLVGHMQGGSITDCQARLSTQDEFGRLWSDMEQRLSLYSIQAGSGKYVGGLVGSTQGTVTMEGSFAAVPVSGRDYVGGLVGSYDGGTIQNCYGSGDVSANSHAGGLAGTLTSSTTMTNCYATSNVTATSFAGGFVGNTTGNFSNFQSCRAYGQTTKNRTDVDIDTSGPFLGHQAKKNAFYDCRYLQQGNYNAGYSGASRDYGAGTGFAFLKATPSNSAALSHPYGPELQNNAFPFPLLSCKGAAMEHYGNWPAELKLQTSLVYYERYADGTYGYYAKTSLTTGAGDTEHSGEANNWIVDTLRKETCLEDGYAILTVYKLSRFNFKLNDGKPQTVYTTESVAEAGDGKAPLITSGASLVFRKNDLSYTISNARVYQLPFNLQITDRASAARFYDKLQFNGYVDSNEVCRDFIFYYCGDFAKNAINPEPGSTNSTVPQDPGGEANPVYVRSARQINGLSRAIYYWNEGNSGLNFYFKQETDVDFGQYVKKYCGRDFNLTDTRKSNQYRNLPIGRPTHEIGSQFRNVYDGGGNLIIDYCSITYADDNNGEGYQFTGLFGEIRKATLKNIHMVASNPGAPDTASSGYVESRFNNSNKRNAGTGALVGLVYVDQNEAHVETQVARVSNCSVSGYEVSNAPGVPYANSALGGLAGYNFGVIENSSASSKLVYAANTSGSLARYVGGLVGSLNGKGQIVNCYAGGPLKVRNYGAAYVGGICGGYNGIYGYGDGNASLRAQRIYNSYSYCTWEKSNLPNANLYSVAPKTDRFTISNCYYLSNTVGSGIYFAATPVNVAEKNFSELSQLEIPGFSKADAAHSYPWSSKLKGRAYPFPAIVQQTDSYVHYGDWYDNFISRPSAFLTYYEQYSDNSWGYHYADNSGQMISTLKDNTVSITRAGYGILLLKDAPTPAFDGNSISLEAAIAGAELVTNDNGVYVLHPIASNTLAKLQPGDHQSQAISFQYGMLDGSRNIPISRTLYLNINFGAALDTAPLPAIQEKPLQIRTAGQLQKMTTGTAAAGWYFKQTHSIVADDITGNLINMGYTFDGGYVGGGSGIVDPGGYTVGSNGHYLFGLHQPLFQTVQAGAVVQNVALLSAEINQSGNAAALALSNKGEIRDSLVKGSVVSTAGRASGLVDSNEGTVTCCYVNGSISAAKNAAGLLDSNSGSITDCYVAGAVQAAVSSGFVGSNGKTMERCYTLASVDGTTCYGFAKGGRIGTYTDCYWVKDANLNAVVSNNSAGTPKKLAEMRKLSLGSSWGKAQASYPDTPNLGTFPYPELNALDHYGDWPMMNKQGKVGAAVLYYNHGNDYKDCAEGVVVDIETQEIQKIESHPGSRWTYKLLLILLPSDRELGSFEIEYDGMPLSGLTIYNGLSNLPSNMTAYYSRNGTVNDNEWLTIKDTVLGGTYTFQSDFYPHNGQYWRTFWYGGYTP